jgi:hypothetical protein
MARMVGDAEFQPNHGSDPSAGPDLSPEAVRCGATVQEFGQAGELLGRQSARGPRWGPVAESLQPALAGTCHPLADSPFANAQGFCNLALRPALLFEVPGLEPSGFFPIVR